MPPEKSRSGTSRSYGERVKAGRPNVTLSLTTETVEMIARLSESLGLSRSAVVTLAIEQLDRKKKVT
jgi:hypothetical protein